MFLFKDKTSLSGMSEREVLAGFDERLSGSWRVLKGEARSWLPAEAWERALPRDALWDVVWDAAEDERERDAEAGDGEESGPAPAAALHASALLTPSTPRPHLGPAQSQDWPEVSHLRRLVREAQASTAQTQTSPELASDWSNFTSSLTPHAALMEHCRTNKDSTLPSVASAGYFKALEMFATASEVLFPGSGVLHTLSLCEGGGSWLRALEHYASVQQLEGRAWCAEWEWLASTLSPTHESTPADTYPFPALLTQHRSRAMLGPSGKGDLLDMATWASLLYAACPRACSSCVSDGRFRAHLVTGDGGGGSWESNELNSFPLLLSEALLAVACARQGGAVILKLHSLLELSTASVMALLCSSFSGVAFTKPVAASKPGNTEVYVIAWERRSDSSLPWLFPLLQRYRAQISSRSVSRTFLKPSSLPDSFLSRLAEDSTFFADRQVHAIRLNLKLFQLAKKKEGLVAKIRELKTGPWMLNWLKKMGLEYWAVDSLAPTFEGMGRVSWATFQGQSLDTGFWAQPVHAAKKLRTFLSLDSEHLLPFAQKLCRKAREEEMRPPRIRYWTLSWTAGGAEVEETDESWWWRELWEEGLAAGGSATSLAEWGAPVESLRSSLFVRRDFLLIYWALAGEEAGRQLLSSELCCHQDRGGGREDFRLGEGQAIRLPLSAGEWARLLWQLFQEGAPAELCLETEGESRLSALTRSSASLVGLLALRFGKLSLQPTRLLLAEGRAAAGPGEWVELRAYLRQLSLLLRAPPGELRGKAPGGPSLLSFLPLQAFRQTSLFNTLRSHNDSHLLTSLSTLICQRIASS